MSSFCLGFKIREYSSYYYYYYYLFIYWPTACSASQNFFDLPGRECEWGGKALY